MSDYNGWKNYETWNVMLWINNEPAIYDCACKFVEDVKSGKLVSHDAYRLFVHWAGLSNQVTPDGVEWLSDDLDYEALHEAMMELVD